MTDLRWTRETPKYSGWYWWRGTAADAYPEIREVLDLELGSGRLSVSSHPDGYQELSGHTFGEWAGPIPEPLEPADPAALWAAMDDLRAMPWEESDGPNDAARPA